MSRLRELFDAGEFVVNTPHGSTKGGSLRLAEPSSRRIASLTALSGPSWVTIATITSPASAARPFWIRLSIETPASRSAAVISANTPGRSATMKRI